MNRKTRGNDSQRIGRVILCLGGLIIAGTATASAQSWQESIGSSGAANKEHAVSTIEAANGDLLVAGSTTQYPYLIRTDGFPDDIGSCISTINRRADTALVGVPMVYQKQKPG